MWRDTGSFYRQGGGVWWTGFTDGVHGAAARSFLVSTSTAGGDRGNAVPRGVLGSSRSLGRRGRCRVQREGANLGGEAVLLRGGIGGQGTISGRGGARVTAARAEVMYVESRRPSARPGGARTAACNAAATGVRRFSSSGRGVRETMAYLHKTPCPFL